MLRRTTAILATTAVVALASTGQAHADTPGLESYEAAATATALELTLGGLLGEPITLTVAGTGAAVTSLPGASADGQALATPLFSTPGAPVASTGAVVTGEDCLNIALPEPINLVDIDITCVRTMAGVTDGDPTATSVSDQIEIEVISAVAVSDLTDTLLRPLLEQVLGALGPIVNPLVGGALDTLIDELLTTLSLGDVLLSIEVAPTSSLATASTDGVVADASSGVARITVLPGLGTAGLVSIGVAETGATVVRDAVTGEATLTSDFDVVSIEPAGLADLLTSVIDSAALSVLGDILGPLLTDLVIGLVLPLLAGVDETLESLIGGLGLGILACDGPLAGLACLSLGGVNELDEAELAARGMDFGEGTEGLEVTTLGLNVLDGTVTLALGQSTAAANAVPADPAPRGPEAPTPTTTTPGPTSLPKTGTDAALPLILALFAVGAAGTLFVRRSRIV